MSPDHESSYYEIALTNRQVLTIFIVLLTCLVAAFLSGVWIGRRDGAEGLLQATAGEEPVEQTTAQMTELNFFTDGPSRDGRDGEPKAPPRRAEPAAKDPAPERPPSPPPDEEKKPPAEKPPVVKPPPNGSPPPAPAAGGGRVIQVFSTLDAAQADKLVRRLGDGGYPAFLLEENLGGRTTYRVRVGPYQQQARAEQIADELRREYRLETWITSPAG